MDANHSASHPLRRWRHARDLTLEQAGELVGVHGTAFGKYELGQRMPRPRVLTKIIQMTGGAVGADAFLPADPPAGHVEAAE